MILVSGDISGFWLSLEPSGWFWTALSRISFSGHEPELTGY